MLSRRNHPTHEKVKSLKTFENYIKWRNDVGMKSQKSLLSSNNGELLVDYVGRFEDLHKHFGIICEKIGVPTVKLPYKKHINKKPYQYYYNSRTRDLVYQFSSEDIEFFNYSFENQTS